MERSERARGCWIVTWALLASGCALDERTLHEGSSFEADAGSGGSGQNSSGGGASLSSTASGGSNSSTSGSGGTSSNGSGGGSATANTTAQPRGTTSGTDLECADLDDNGTPDCEETLAHNAAFDSDAEEWLPETQVELDWTEDGTEGDSGAIQVVNLSHGTGTRLTMAGTYQCIYVKENVNYSFYAETFIPGGQPAGLAAISAWFFDANNCSGEPLETVTSAMLSTTDRWRLLQAEATAPLKANSMRVRLVAVKQEVHERLEVHFDNVLVRRE